MHELAREQKAGLGVPVLHALVVGIKSVKRTEKKPCFYTCTSLNFEEKSHEKMLKIAFRREYV